MTTEKQTDQPHMQADGPHASNVWSSAERIVESLMSGDRVALAQAITLIESSAAEHSALAEAVLSLSAPHAGNSIRVGFSGVPGAGKSTLIEKLGIHLIGAGHRVAVLAIDPSSTQSGGSILGDKTRMDELSREQDAFIRPTPSRGSLGGVSARTRETITLCEAAGYDVVLVETVGVGQSEADVARLSDFVYLLVVTGGGDELQGIKRGLIEFADAVLVSKADGDNAEAANAAASMYRTVLGLFRERDSGCVPEVRTVSSVTGHGVEEAWSLAEEYRRRTQENGYWQRKRRDQLSFWLRTSLLMELQRRVSSSQVIAAELPKIEEQVRTGQLTPRSAASRILEAYIQSESTITGSRPVD